MSRIKARLNKLTDARTNEHRSKVIILKPGQSLDRQSHADCTVLVVLPDNGRDDIDALAPAQSGNRS